MNELAVWAVRLLLAFSGPLLVVAYVGLMIRVFSWVTG